MALIPVNHKLCRNYLQMIIESSQQENYHFHKAKTITQLFLSVNGINMSKYQMDMPYQLPSSMLGCINSF